MKHLLFFLLCAVPLGASAQPVDCVALTGRSGHLIVPAGVWQSDPATVRAFGTDGDCVGEGTISAAPSAVTMWGYDEMAHQYQGLGGLREGEPIRLASAEGDLAVRLVADQPYLSKRLVWSSDMIAVAAMVAPADSLFIALDSLEAAVQALAQDRAALAQQVANQADQIVGLQQQAAALMGERDAALAMLAPVEAERDSLASEVDDLTQERDALAEERAELAIRVDEQATTIESATTRIRAITRGL